MRLVLQLAFGIMRPLSLPATKHLSIITKRFRRQSKRGADESNVLRKRKEEGKALTRKGWGLSTNQERKPFEVFRGDSDHDDELIKFVSSQERNG